MLQFISCTPMSCGTENTRLSDWPVNPGPGRQISYIVYLRSETAEEKLRGENHEGRNPSSLLPGKGCLQLWQRVRDRIYEEGHPRRGLL